MEKYCFSREEILNKFEDNKELILRGKELREKGYKYHSSVPCALHLASVEVPSSRELFNETQMKVRYANYNHQQELREAFEYLILCEEKLVNVSDLEFRLS